jgi:hypothetical protein
VLTRVDYYHDWIISKIKKCSDAWIELA